MGDGSQGLRPLPQRLAGELGHAVLGGHILDHGAGGGNRAPPGDTGDDVGLQGAVLLLVGSVQADKALAPFGAVGPLQKVHLSPDAGELPGPGGLPVLLAHQVHFHSAVDADDIAHPADALHRVDVVHIPGAEQLGLLIQPVVQLLRAHSQIPGGPPPVHLFSRVGQLARLPQLQKGVADGPRVAAQVSPVRLGQQLGHGEGHAAHPQGQHRPVGDLLHHQLGDL